jgi:hypothetical protein
MRNKDLEEKIYLYIKEHEGDNIDSTDIINRFTHYNNDVLLRSINHLRVNKRIERISIGIYYKFTTLN